MRRAVGWRRPIGCILFLNYFPQTSPISSGSFTQNDPRIKAFYGSSPSGTQASDFDFIFNCTLESLNTDALVCMYMCMYIYSYIYIYISMSFELSARMLKYICTCMYSYVYVCIHIHVYIYTYMYIYIHLDVCLIAHWEAQIHMHMYVCICTCMYKYIHTYIYTYIHTYTYTSIYTYFLKKFLHSTCSTRAAHSILWNIKFLRPSIEGREGLASVKETYWNRDLLQKRTAIQSSLATVVNP